MHYETYFPSDAEKGILRVWTVNKSTPVETCVLKDTGFHVLCATRVERVPVTQKVHPDLSSDHASERKGFMIPNVAIVTLFKDGGVGLYHLRRKQWIFNREHVRPLTEFCLKEKCKSIFMYRYMYIGKSSNLCIYFIMCSQAKGFLDTVVP